MPFFIIFQTITFHSIYIEILSVRLPRDPEPSIDPNNKRNLCLASITKNNRKAVTGGK